MRANIHDIAKKTGLSLGTISNYLNGKSIKEKNRALIEQAIKELDYKVNFFGRNLKTNKSGVIGVMVPNLDDPFAPRIISFVERYMRDNNYAVMVCSSHGSKDIESDVIDFFIERRVEGVIVFPSENDYKRYNLLAENGIPAVAIDMLVDNFKGDFVAVDNKEMLKNATSYLIERGHRRIGIICGHDGSYSADERLAGYKLALEDAGIEYDKALVKRGYYTEQSVAYDLVLEVLSEKDRPTAIIATNYFLTIGAVSAFNSLGYSPGKDISFFGIDNFMLTDIITPKLTVMEQPLQEMSVGAAQALLDRIKDGNKEYKQMFYDGVLLEGNSIVNISER